MKLCVSRNGMKMHDHNTLFAQYKLSLVEPGYGAGFMPKVYQLYVYRIGCMEAWCGACALPLFKNVS